MASVTFSATVGGDGSTVTDDGNPSTGLDAGGHRTRFVPCLAQTVAVAAYTVGRATAAASSASAAATSASNAASSASAAAGSASNAAVVLFHYIEVFLLYHFHYVVHCKITK